MWHNRLRAKSRFQRACE